MVQHRCCATDIGTYRLNRSRGQFSENCVEENFNNWFSSPPEVFLSFKNKYSNPDEVFPSIKKIPPLIFWLDNLFSVAFVFGP